MTQTVICKRLGALCFQERKAKGISQRTRQGLREAAKEIGISASTLSRLELGHNIDVETFRKVCVWLGADANEVLGLERKK